MGEKIFTLKIFVYLNLCGHLLSMQFLMLIGSKKVPEHRQVLGEDNGESP